MSPIIAQNLFSNSQQNAVKSLHLIEIKAGKMIRENTLVKPDLRKGLVYLSQSEDGLLHFCWKDRSSGKIEEDLIVFPEEAEWIKLSECTTGRVYVLKFKSSSQKHFFWLQDASTEKDDSICTKMNALLKSPPAPGSSNESEHNEQQQLMQILQAQGLLEPLREAAENTSSSSICIGGTSLASRLTPDLVAPVLKDSSMCSQLFPLLPINHEYTVEEVESVIRSPQFQEALESLDNAIQSGNHGPLLAELGIDPSVAFANGDRVVALLKAIKKRFANDDRMNTD